MYLQEKLRLYDSNDRPRLSYARSYFQQFGLNVDSGFKELLALFGDWRDFNEYIVLQKQSGNLRIKGEVDKETIAVKCAKRGTDVYWWRVGKRLKSLYNLNDHALFDPHGNVKLSNVLFFTLTYDIKRSTIPEAWENTEEEINRWISNLRKKHGRISYLRC